MVTTGGRRDVHPGSMLIVEPLRGIHVVDDEVTCRANGLDGVFQAVPLSGWCVCEHQVELSGGLHHGESVSDHELDEGRPLDFRGDGGNVLVGLRRHDVDIGTFG
jgi:hypothetical protein